MPEGNPSAKRNRQSATARMLDTTVLYSAEAEKAVLGCCLAQPSEVIPEASAALRREDFFVPAHKELFRILVTMFDGMEAIDVMTVHERISRERLDKDIGSPGILAELLVGFATHLNIGSYILIVKERAIAREMIDACSAITRDVMDMPDSVASCLDRAETLFGNIGKFGTRNRILTLKQCCENYRIRREAIQIGEITPRIPTGIDAIDKGNGGLPIPSYVIIAGEMASGKSDLMIQITRHRAILGMGVGMFSFEMTEHEILERLVSEYAHINSRRLVGKLHQREEEAEEWALREFEKWNVHIDPTAGLGPDEIRRGTRRMVDAGCNLIFLDNAQLAKGSNDRQERHMQLTEVSRTIQELYKEHEITFCLLVQCKQANMGKKDGDGAKKILGEYDLADCAAFQRDGRVIIVINSVEGHHPMESTPILINIAKFSQGQTAVEPATYNKPEHRIW